MVKKINKPMGIGGQGIAYSAYCAGLPWESTAFPYVQACGKSRREFDYAGGLGAYGQDYRFEYGNGQEQSQSDVEGNQAQLTSARCKENHASLNYGFKQEAQRRLYGKKHREPWYEGSLVPHVPFFVRANEVRLGKGHRIREQSCNIIGKPRDGYVTIETSEHQHLLHLYYTVYDDSVRPSAETEHAYLEALEKCNSFYEGKSYATSKM